VGKAGDAPKNGRQSREAAGRLAGKHGDLTSRRVTRASLQPLQEVTAGRTCNASTLVRLAFPERDRSLAVMPHCPFAPDGRFAAVVLLLAGVLPAARAAAPLTAGGRALLAASLGQGDALWDEQASLLRSIPEPGTRTPSHPSRGTAWYALGLMMRNGPGDRARSLRAFDAVMALQYRQPAVAWDGTFARNAEDPTPPAKARMWKDYDPNWREFIGTVLALALEEYSDAIPADEQARMRETIRRAVEGELHEKRLVPTYTNIALMHGFLWADAGRRLDRPAWVRDAEAWTETVHRAFTAHGTFDEFNSPTYYGVDLYGLALLRQHGTTPRLRELGAEMEAGLWRDIAQFYHAGLRNLCGPFDRAYGMDMTRYVSLVGLWIGLELPVDPPLPPIAPKMEHGHDFLFAPCFALLGARIPDEARPAFASFQGERLLTRTISNTERVATAWLGRDLMIGAESTGRTRAVTGPAAQFHPATIHWRTSDGGIGWIALVQSPPVDARASRGELSIATKGDCVVRISCAAVTPAQIGRDRWQLPGLELHVTADGEATARDGSDHTVDVTFRGVSRIVFHVETGATASDARHHSS
jgi:hypothetical protein